MCAGLRACTHARGELLHYGCLDHGLRESSVVQRTAASAARVRARHRAERSGVKTERYPEASRLAGRTQLSASSHRAREAHQLESETRLSVCLKHRYSHDAA